MTTLVQSLTLANIHTLMAKKTWLEKCRNTLDWKCHLFPLYVDLSSHFQGKQQSYFHLFFHFKIWKSFSKSIRKTMSQAKKFFTHFYLIYLSKHYTFWWKIVNGIRFITTSIHCIVKLKWTKLFFFKLGIGNHIEILRIKNLFYQIYESHLHKREFHINELTYYLLL